MKSKPPFKILKIEKGNFIVELTQPLEYIQFDIILEDIQSTESKKCSCSMNQLMMSGCECGSVKRYGEKY